MKLLRLLVICMFPVVGLLACGEAHPSAITTVAKAPEQAVNPPTAMKRKKIGLVMKTLTNPFFIEMKKGARRAGSASSDPRRYLRGSTPDKK